MTREKQINEASQGMATVSEEFGFQQGAKWADLHPECPAVSATIRNKIIDELSAKLALAIESLDNWQVSFMTMEAMQPEDVQQAIKLHFIDALNSTILVSKAIRMGGTDET